jgi:hypothetical protein
MMTQKSNILKYAKWTKYSLTYEIFSNMQKKISTKSELNESFTFFILIKLHRPSNNMQKHINPVFNNNY